MPSYCLLRYMFQIPIQQVRFHLELDQAEPLIVMPQGALFFFNFFFFNFLLFLLICGSLLEWKVVDQIEHQFFIAGVVVVDLLFHLHDRGPVQAKVLFPLILDAD
jgi:hypothetical protein